MSTVHLGQPVGSRMRRVVDLDLDPHVLGRVQGQLAVGPADGVRAGAVRLADGLRQRVACRRVRSQAQRCWHPRRGCRAGAAGRAPGGSSANWLPGYLMRCHGPDVLRRQVDAVRRRGVAVGRGVAGRVIGEVKLPGIAALRAGDHVGQAPGRVAALVGVHQGSAGIGGIGGAGDAVSRPSARRPTCSAACLAPCAGPPGRRCCW